MEILSGGIMGRLKSFTGSRHRLSSRIDGQDGANTVTAYRLQQIELLADHQILTTKFQG